VQSKLVVRRRALAAQPFLLFALFLLVSCGGGGGGGNSSGPAPPTALSYATPQSYIVGVAIAPLSPSVSGTATSYAASPALPAGLSLNASTGVISGTPTATAASAAYVVTASNSSGSTTFTLTLTVLPHPPTALSYPTPTLFAVNQPIVPINPTVQGMVTSYSVAPALPAGVALDSSSGTISGTPTATQAATTYKVTASNTGGSTWADVSIGVVTLTVTPGKVARMAVGGTSVTIVLTLTPIDFSFSGTLYASVVDATGAFASSATVAAPAAGSYAVSLTTSSTASASQYTGSLVLNLCSDAACGTPQPLHAIVVPFGVNILTSASAWLGNNLTTLTSWAGAADWTTYQGNAAHTGYVDVTLDPNQFTTRWQGPAISQSGDAYYTDNATLVTSNGVLFIPSGLALYARNESDGSLVWSYDVSGLQFPSVNPPAVANGAVYMAAGQQSSTYMFAFNASDGSLLFQSPMSSQWEHYLAPVVGASGVYTDAGEYGGMYGFNTAGTQLFFDGSLMQTDEWTPAVDASYVYAYTGNDLWILNPVSGATVLQIPDPTFTNFVYEVAGSVVLGDPGYAFAANYANSNLSGCGIGNTLLGFNTTLGTIRWQVAGCYPSTPAYNAGLLYVANDNPVQLEVRSATDGSLQWSWTPPLAADTRFDSEVLLTQNMAFVSTNNAIYGIDITTHKTIWGYPFVGRLALSANGVLYLQNAGPLTAINVK
jgi:hypothetical protein